MVRDTAIFDIIEKERPKKTMIPGAKMAESVFDAAGPVDLDKLGLTEKESAELIDELEKEMLAAAASLEFERAADLRDRIRKLRKS